MRKIAITLSIVRYGGLVDEITEGAIALLRRDGRATFSDLARRLGTTRLSISRRIAPMIEDGSLQVVAAVHPRLLGLDVLAHLMVRADGDIKGLAQMISEIESIVFISEVTGQVQLVIELHVTDLTALYRDLRAVRALPGVKDVAVMLYERMLRSFFLGEEPLIKPPALDEVDLQIMDLLQDDGRLGYAEMSEAVSLSISACHSRVTRLIETGAMQIGAIVRRGNGQTDGYAFGFGIVFDGDETPILDVLFSVKTLEFCVRGVGQYDIVATIIFSSLPDLSELLDRLRRAPGVRHVDEWMHTRVHQERYQNSLARIRAVRSP